MPALGTFFLLLRCLVLLCFILSCLFVLCRPAVLCRGNGEGINLLGRGGVSMVTERREGGH